MYRSMESVDEALNNRPHVLDGKEVDPKRAVAKEVCDMEEYIDVAQSLFIAHAEAKTESSSTGKLLSQYKRCFGCLYLSFSVSLYLAVNNILKYTKIDTYYEH